MVSAINTFVYNECFSNDVQAPDIPVYARPYFGQCAEDLIVVAILKAISVRENVNLAEQRYLEIGANHPIATSATYLMHRELGMRGVLVEANSQLLPTLRKVRPRDTIKHAAISIGDEPFIDFYVSNQSELSSLSKRFVEEWRAGIVGLARTEKVPALRVNTLLREEFFDDAPIFLSIDVEGLDLDILMDWDWDRWRPAIIQTEPSDHFHEGNSAAIEAYLKSQGYMLIAKTDVNLVAVDRQRFSEAKDAELAVATASRLRDTIATLEEANSKLAEASAAASRALGAANSELNWLRGQTAEKDDLILEMQLLSDALPYQLRSPAFLAKLESGAVKWWHLAIQAPWNVTVWQTARRLQRRKTS